MTMETSSSFEPKVGMGATHVLFSDRHAYTVIEVISSKKVIVQRDNVTYLPYELVDRERCLFSHNKNGETVTISRRKNGHWQEVNGHRRFSVGRRDEYFDPSF